MASNRKKLLSQLLFRFLQKSGNARFDKHYAMKANTEMENDVRFPPFYFRQKKRKKVGRTHRRSRRVTTFSTGWKLFLSNFSWMSTTKVRGTVPFFAAKLYWRQGHRVRSMNCAYQRGAGLQAGKQVEGTPYSPKVNPVPRQWTLIAPANSSLSSTHIVVGFNLSRISSRQTSDVLMDFYNSRHLPDTTSSGLYASHFCSALCENEAARKTFLPGTGTAEWRRWRNEERHTLYLSITKHRGGQMMGSTCSTYKADGSMHTKT
jgi:hypothetical protein